MKKRMSSIATIAKFFFPKKIDLYNAEHPVRQKAIHLLEDIEGKLIKAKLISETALDGVLWYELEDLIVEIIK